MSENFDIVSFAVALAVNLFLCGIVAAFGLAAAFRLAKTASPRARYTIAVAVFLIVSFAPFVITLRGVSKIQPTSATASIEPYRTLDVSLPEPNIETENLSAQDLASVSAIKERFAAALDGFVLSVSGSEFSKVFFAVWVFISGLLLWRELVSHQRLARMRKDLQPASVSLREALLCPNDLRLYVGESETPATVGLFRSVVIFPAHFPKSISCDAARSILRHEAAHARWRDPLVNALLRVVRAAFWISPGLWFIERVIRDEREAAADCAALADPKSENCEAATIDYAASLVAVAKLSKQFSRQKRFGAAATQFGGSARLEKRVRRLFAGNAKNSPARLSLAVVVVMFSILGALLLPAASQPLRQQRQLLADSKPKDIFQKNDSVGQNLSADFVEKIENVEKAKDGRITLSSVAFYQSKNRSSSDAVEDESGISAQPTPPVNSDEKTSKSSRENENNESSNDVILSVPTQEVTKPLPVVLPVPVIPAVKPLQPQSSEISKLKPVPELPKLKSVPELPKLKLVVESAQNQMPKR